MARRERGEFAAHLQLLFTSGWYNEERARIWLSWSKAFLENLQLAAGDPAVPGISSGQTMVFDGHHPGAKMVPSALRQWWDSTSICFDNCRKGTVRLDELSALECTVEDMISSSLSMNYPMYVPKMMVQSLYKSHQGRQFATPQDKPFQGWADSY